MVPSFMVEPVLLLYNHKNLWNFVANEKKVIKKGKPSPYMVLVFCQYNVLRLYVPILQLYVMIASQILIRIQSWWQPHLNDWGGQRLGAVDVLLLVLRNYSSLCILRCDGGSWMA